MDELKSPGKPFGISKRAVWEAWEKVRANKGAPGVDGESIADFEKDLKGNLYKIWNRMSSGTYFPPPVRAVEIAKAHGTGTRMLGVPTVADRVAQTVVAGVLEERAERLFRPDSYGYRPRRSALDALAACRRRCWETDWVIDLDIQKFFAPNAIDNSAHGRPPCQYSWLLVAARCVLGWGCGVGWCFLGSDEDVFDQQSQDALAFGGTRVVGVAVELGEESFQVIGEFEVGVAVGELGVEGVGLAAHVRLAGRQVGHPGAELVDGDELFLERLDHPGDRGAAFAVASSSRLRCLAAGSLVRAWWRRLSISARSAAGQRSGR